jgi:large subunit ribosomal protein L10
MIVLDEMSELPELGEILEAAPCALRTGALLFLGPDQISATRKRCTRSASEVGTLWRTRMARPDKAAAVTELAEKFSSSQGAVLTEYRGLTVKALKELRRSLGDDATYAVSKNTLTTIAAREAGVEGVEEHLVGPTAIAFIEGDPVTVAKGLRDFARQNPLLVIKGGVLDGKSLSADEVKKLADLESREVLLAKVAGGMQGVLQQAISLVAAPLSQAARVFAALEKAAEENPSLIAGAGTAPEAEQSQEPTNDEIAAEATASDENAAEANESAAPAAEPTPEAADAAADQ